MQDINQLLIFACVAQTGSVTTASHQLGVSKSHISKQLSRLEDELDLRLFVRLARGLQLTEQGLALLPYANTIWQASRDALSEAQQIHGEVSGNVRVMITQSLMRKLVLPHLAAFLKLHPKLRLQFDVRHGSIREIAENCDLAIMIGEPPDSNLIGRPLGSIRPVFVATPDYLSTHGEPTTPTQIQHHQYLLASHPQLSDDDHWALARGEELYQLRIPARLRVNDADIQKEMVLAHIGIAVLSRVTLQDELDSGALVEILSDFRFINEPPVYLLYHDRKHQAPSIKVVRDFLLRCLGPLIQEGMGMTGEETVPAKHSPSPLRSS